MLPGAFEWNLMANREGWGSTNKWEWTITKFRDTQYGRGATIDSVFLIIGSSDHGGAAKVERKLDVWSSENWGLRLAVFFAP